MSTKLNLTLKESTVRRIKIYAEKHKVSVSRIAEEYFEKLTQPKKHNTGKTRFTERAGGIINDLNIDDISKEKDNYLKEKYGV